MDVLSWLLLAALFLAALAGYIYSPTRPYVVKYWWALVGVAALVAGYALLRRRPGNPIDKTLAEGEDIAEANTAAVDLLIDTAQENYVRADLELERKRLDNWADKAVFDDKVAVVNTIEDSVERRKALIKLVESTR